MVDRLEERACTMGSIPYVILPENVRALTPDEGGRLHKTENRWWVTEVEDDTFDLEGRFMNTDKSIFKSFSWRDDGS